MALDVPDERRLGRTIESKGRGLAEEIAGAFHLHWKQVQAGP
jgi:hypothetical protein